MSTNLDRKKLKDHARGVRRAFEETLRAFVEVPSVSMDPQRKGDIARMAELAHATLTRHGAEARVIKTRGNPLVTGSFRAGRNCPTVTVYNHLDVQPAGEPEWKTEPFRLVVEKDTYRGRGTTDDKGPALTALYGALAARDAGVPINVNFLWELEEEIGSPSFEKAIRAEAARLATDSVVVSDTVWVDRSRPACPAGLRGLQTFLLRLETGVTDQHSGTAGGAARNPLGELMQLASELHDAKTGRVRIKGFYDDVERPDRAELESFRKCGFSVRKFKKDHSFRSLRSEEPLEVMKRIWAMPTLEVHGLTGGYAGEGVKTVIPPRGELKLSCRLVPNQRPSRIVKLVRDFVKERFPDVKLTAEAALEPYRGHTTGPYADAIVRAMEFAFGTAPVFVREGGSIGAVVSMEKVLRVPVLFLGLSLPEHGYHAPNECYDWAQAEGGIAAFARYFGELASLR